MAFPGKNTRVAVYIYIHTMYTHTHTHTHTHTTRARAHTHTHTHAQWYANKNLANGSSEGLRMPWFVESANFYVLNPAWWISSYNMRSKNSVYTSGSLLQHMAVLCLRIMHGNISNTGTSLVVQWLRIHLPMQGHRFNPWSRKIPHASEQLSPCATTTEPSCHG